MIRNEILIEKSKFQSFNCCKQFKPNNCMFCFHLRQIYRLSAWFVVKCLVRQASVSPGVKTQCKSHQMQEVVSKNGFHSESDRTSLSDCRDIQPDRTGIHCTAIGKWTMDPKQTAARCRKNGAGGGSEHTELVTGANVSLPVLEFLAIVGRLLSPVAERPHTPCTAARPPVRTPTCRTMQERFTGVRADSLNSLGAP